MRLDGPDYTALVDVDGGRDPVGARRKEDGAAASRQRIHGGLNGDGVVVQAVAERSEVPHVLKERDISSDRDGCGS
jgi:hypothetical protein